jgi:hypothetical protein
MPTDLELMNLHACALFTHGRDGRILLVNEPDKPLTPAPRFFLARTHEGSIWRFRADLSDDICEQLAFLCASEPSLRPDSYDSPRHAEEFKQLLEIPSTPIESFSGLAYQFIDSGTTAENLVSVTEENAELLCGGFEEMIEELHAWQPFVALIKENRAVSLCRSVRITAAAHEAGVETLPEYRGRGYAKEVTPGWAQLVRQIGAIPLYSTSVDNEASQAVARKLGLKLYGATFSIV